MSDTVDDLCDPLYPGERQCSPKISLKGLISSTKFNRQRCDDLTSRGQARPGINCTHTGRVWEHQGTVNSTVEVGQQGFTVIRNPELKVCETEPLDLSKKGLNFSFQL